MQNVLRAKFKFFFFHLHKFTCTSCHPEKGIEASSVYRCRVCKMLDVIFLFEDYFFFHSRVPCTGNSSRLIQKILLQHDEWYRLLTLSQRSPPAPVSHMEMFFLFSCFNFHFSTILVVLSTIHQNPRSFMYRQFYSTIQTFSYICVCCMYTYQFTVHYRQVVQAYHVHCSV